ncbi:MAG: DUF5343 domain-containing protein [Candidatus Acidiferrum sp.]
MASSFTYTSVPNSLRQFLKGVPNRGIPPKVSGKHLKSIGLKESNDQSIIRVLKFVGLLNSDGSPSEIYKGFRDKSRGPNLLAQQILKAYKDLFDTYPDAQAQSDENLRNFFTGKTDLGKAAIGFTVSTFKVLCEFGDFSDSKGPLASGSSAGHSALGAGSGGGAGAGSGSGPAVHINLQIHLPEATDPATYDAIFAAINRHLGKLL